MTIVVTGHSMSLDGFIAGDDDSPEHPLGAGGDRLFDWFSDGDTPSRYYPEFKMSVASGVGCSTRSPRSWWPRPRTWGSSTLYRRPRQPSS